MISTTLICIVVAWGKLLSCVEPVAGFYAAVVILSRVLLAIRCEL